MENTKQKFIDLAYLKFGIKANETINFEQAFEIIDEIDLSDVDAALNFIDVVQNDENVFIGHLDEENYIEIQYVGDKDKNIKIYKIQVWRYECGCIYEEIKRFSNINQAILWISNYINNE